MSVTMTWVCVAHHRDATLIGFEDECMTDAPDWPDATDKAAFWTCAWIESAPKSTNRRLNPDRFQARESRRRTPKEAVAVSAASVASDSSVLRISSWTPANSIGTQHRRKLP
jgi:hypothetical protein